MFRGDIPRYSPSSLIPAGSVLMDKPTSTVARGTVMPPPAGMFDLVHCVNALDTLSSAKSSSRFIVLDMANLNN
ncbi:Uncharacterised protein [Mycobacteroides abscessus subsp. massiliense]|nr:Uncharacterised protein [Mycobacteroides abscessus subsp. massiliense]